MVVPLKRNHRTGLVSRAGLETRAAWRAGSAARASTSAVAKTTHRASGGVRRVRCSPAVCVATSMSATRPATTTAPPARRGDANRNGAAHQSDFVKRRTPPRHPPRGPPKIRQCRSQPRARHGVDAGRDAILRALGMRESLTRVTERFSLLGSRFILVGMPLESVNP